ncbi:hypothetical protein SteCoe_18859 [Stentor coeruleus]|uniref:Uncharacterized protein n=1 Tax=Stentor coeruleus TaxID=5963 RepID=A0A1R2BW39_9CILI|nr:hypothetical protein SteCoe_18859 [Stentor coeruleus]
MSQTSRTTHEKIISLPKHITKQRDEISPIFKTKNLKNPMGTRLLLNTKKSKSALNRQKILQNSYEDDMTILISVERSYVRELIKSPMKLTPTSPKLEHKFKHLSPNKAKNKPLHNFGSLTSCDFFNCNSNKKISSTQRVKFSFTPEVLNKKK